MQIASVPQHQWVALLYVAGMSGPVRSVEVNGIYLHEWVSAFSLQFAVVLDGKLFYLMSVRKAQMPLGLDFFAQDSWISLCSVRPTVFCLWHVLDLGGVWGKWSPFPI